MSRNETIKRVSQPDRHETSLKGPGDVRSIGGVVDEMDQADSKRGQKPFAVESRHLERFGEKLTLTFVDDQDSWDSS